MSAPDRITQIGLEFDESQQRYKVVGKPPVSPYVLGMVGDSKLTLIHLSTRSDPGLSSVTKVRIALGIEQDPEND